MPNALRSPARNRVFIVLLTLLLGTSAFIQQKYFPRRVQAVSATVVISEFRTRGPNGAADEFIELYNLTNSPIDIGGWKINGSNNAAGVSTRLTISAGTIIPAHGHFLATNSSTSGGPYSGAVAGNQTFATGITDDGGIAVLTAANAIIDQVGMSVGSAYKEGTILTPLTTAGVNQGYERKPGGSNGSTQDTDNNSADFQLRAPSDPQNLSSAATPAGNQGINTTCPNPPSTPQGTASSVGVSATDPDGTVTSAIIQSGGAPGISLDGFTPAAGVGGTANATLNVANTTAAGTYNVTIRYSNNDPTPQTADCTVVVTVTPPNQAIVPSCAASLNTSQGTAASTGVSATDPDGIVVSASIISSAVPGITLDNFVAAASSGGTATATLNVANTTAVGTYNVTIRYSNNDATPQTADCTVVVNVNVAADSVVISQVYGGGGNTGSTYKNDYIELMNHSSVPVNLNGWSVQAWSFASNSWQATPLTNVTLQPGQYYLVQESQGAGGTDDLPTPDAIGTIAVSSGSTKVALVSNTTPISSACPGSNAYVDLVGYGTDPVIGTCHEGSGAAPQLSNTIAIQRRNEGCFDSDDNAADFITIAPTPHNTASAVHDCTGLSAFGSANPSTVLQGDSTTLTVRVDPAQNPSSTGVSVTADLTSIGGSASQSFAGSGDVFTYFATVPANNPPGMKSLPVTVTDAQARTANTNILVSILPTIADHVTISQLYGGGGNSGATYTNDYVELYNPTAATISLTGWSIQYGPATGSTFTGKTVIGGTIAPGAHYLISLASGGGPGAPLPPASVNGDINMSATAGKVALVSNSETVAGPCPLGTDSDIVDFIGYGSTANCHEGSANAPQPTNNTKALFRKNSGQTDTDQNGNDFVNGDANPRSESPIVEFGPTVANADPANNSTTAPYDSTITVDFSEPVTVDSGWYNISCTVTGVHSSVTEAHTSNLKTYAVTPNQTFQFGEQCTVTITKTAVHDVDTDDSDPDTDTLPADFIWSFTVVGAGQPAPYPPSVHLTMGNPSNATASLSDFNNFLMEKPTYSLSYNRDKGTPNWVSWHLDNTWYGTLARVDTFRPDPAVDPTWYRVQAFDYSGTGFDRGHMTPNADRDNQNRVPINQETYLMSNMVPQAPNNNQGPWAQFEAYLRTQADANNEIYIVSGPSGIGGVGSVNGDTVNTIAGGHVTVPSATWKVALLLPKMDGDDASRVVCSSRTIAILIPNSNSTVAMSTPWQNYLTTVDAIEQLTGYDFYSNLPAGIQNCVETGTDGQNNNHPGTEGQSVTTNEETAVAVTLTAESANANPLTYTIVSGPSHGTLTGSDGNRTYTPDLDYFGPDSFTFKVNDGVNDSNTSTVSITVNNVNDAPVATGDSYVTDSNTALNVPAPGVLGNDSDIDGPSLSAQLVSNVSHGTLTLNSDGSFSYGPASDYEGTDSFTYRAYDGSLGSNVVTVDITVNDRVAPVITSSIGMSVISSTNSNLFNVGLVASATDNSGDPVNVQVAVFGDEDDHTPTANNTVHSPDAKDIGPNNTLRLRGERVEANDGRVYLIIITATDSSNNVSRAYHTVVVPKSNKQANTDLVNAQAAAAVAYAQTHSGNPPPAYFVIGDGPIIGPKQ
ncbi:MAG TPA: DNA/RNA non-specific endonuclease [Pyrinomonadaceae bacterium]|nr:DNA/RNA non-specific endonuclease [Pyrinomonadaceae bacterium]